MRTVVAALDKDCVAHRVLTAEGVTHELLLCEGEFGYGEHLASLWERGEGFVVVEHDIAPWVGAIRQLEECQRDWCMFHYFKLGTMTRGLGCTKFSDRLVGDYPDLFHAWEGVSWKVLDGSVGAAVAETLRAEDPQHPLCYHIPCVAHARAN